jgi:hypothetical protein
MKELIQRLRAEASTDRAQRTALDFVLNEAADALERLSADAVLRIEWRNQDGSQDVLEWREYPVKSLANEATVILPNGHGVLSLLCKKSNG